jgi:hypothetical protein
MTKTAGWLKRLGIATGLLVALLATVVYAIAANRSEKVTLVNDGPQVLRVDHCDIDGLQIPPGRYNWPIPVTDKMSCPVYRNNDAAYLGCLVIHRQNQGNRQIQILQSLQPGIAVGRCDRGADEP